jgi:uncharacterized C2H2 Zn-finger protein
MTFSTGNGLGGPTKEQTMFGTILVRCPQCEQLSYDPRTGLCDARHVDESWDWRLPEKFQDLAA